MQIDAIPFISALMGSVLGSCAMLMLALFVMPTAADTVSEYMRRLAKKRWRKRK